VGKWKWEWGSGKMEVGMGKWENGSGKLEVGIRNAAFDELRRDKVGKMKTEGGN